MLAIELRAGCGTLTLEVLEVQRDGEGLKPPIWGMQELHKLQFAKHEQTVRVQ